MYAGREPLRRIADRFHCARQAGSGSSPGVMRFATGFGSPSLLQTLPMHVRLPNHTVHQMQSGSLLVLILPSQETACR